jgi:hypothetical protein
LRSEFGRAALALVLAGVHFRRRIAHPPKASRAAAILGPLLAVAGPALLVGRALGRPRARWVWPTSTSGRIAVVTHAVSAAFAEELSCRATLLRVAPGWRRRSAAALAGGAFVLAHLRRDGRGAWRPHAMNTASWTASTLIARRIRWPVLAHVAYDIAALTIHEASIGVGE